VVAVGSSVVLEVVAPEVVGRSLLVEPSVVAVVVAAAVVAAGSVLSPLPVEGSPQARVRVLARAGIQR
jgi:hypothetical protein